MKTDWHKFLFCVSGSLITLAGVYITTDLIQGRYNGLGWLIGTLITGYVISARRID